MVYTNFDLHLHLDGSLPTWVVLELMERNVSTLTLNEKELLNIANKQERATRVTDTLLRAPTDCDSLAEYLKCFDLPGRLMQKPEDVQLATYALVDRLGKSGIRYAEIRFAPQLHSVKIQGDVEKYFHEAKIIQAVMDGAKLAMKNYENLKINFILCCMRNLPDGEAGYEANLRTVNLAKDFLGKGVVAIDLAGAEARDATSEFAPIFHFAAEQGVPFTIHAGEAGPNLEWKLDSIRSAIEFGAKRIGHGIAIAESPELMELAKKNNVTMECCPVSNLQTKAVVDGIENHPIKKLLYSGVLVTVNTDNLTVSNTSIREEFKAIGPLGIAPDDVAMLEFNAIKAAFISAEEKKNYIDELILGRK